MHFENLLFVTILRESFENVKGSLLIEKLFTILTIITHEDTGKFKPYFE
jgi:hypothetical protein